MAFVKQQIWSSKHTIPDGKPNAGSKLAVSIEAVSEQSAQINIIGYISPYWNDSETFRYQVQSLKRQGYNHLDIYLNTFGGSTVEAAEIINVLDEFRRDGGTVSGRGGAMVASAGTRIAIAISPFEQAKNGLFMIHKPSGTFDGNEDEIASGLILLQHVTSEYASAYSHRTQMSETEVRALWEKGDYWMTADKAAELKFIDKVSDEVAITDDDLSALSKSGHPNATAIAASWEPNKIQKREPSGKSATQFTEMKRETLIALLGLNDDATEEQIKAEINRLKKSATDLSALTQQNELQAQQQKADKIKSILDTAVTERRITAENRAHYEKVAETTDPENLQAMIETLPKVESLAQGLQGKSGGPEAGKDWNYDQWMEKDPEGLKALMTTDFDRFNALYKAKYRKDAPKL